MKNESQMSNKYPILSTINSPCDIKKLTQPELKSLAAEIRGFLVENVSKTGGHLASNLGVIELSIALHRVFDSPRDHIIWDVGHQSYVHKILTGRRERFATLRQGGGLSGFTSRDESEHDCFGAGHSSTSLSAALGFAEAEKLNGSDAYTVAVVGDGAYTGGMIHEALNNCERDLRLIIVINENEMSISKNTGRFARCLVKLRSKPGYFQTKLTTGRIIKRIPFVGRRLFELIRDTKKLLKNIMYGSNYFEDLGLYYLGPADGHDEEQVETLLREAKKLGESVILHIKTKKGKGYPPAEAEPLLYHNLPPASETPPGATYSTECGRILCSLAKADQRITAITAAMSYGTGLEAFRKACPERFFDVGIAEAHALTFAAGLAAAGKIPVVAIYSTFLQRGFDSIIHDIALQRLPVIMCIDRAGLNPADGVTHAGVFDVAFLSGLPGVRIYTPATFEALERALKEAVAAGCPCAVRYPAGGEDPRIIGEFYSGQPAGRHIVTGRSMPKDPEVVIVSHGRIAAEAVGACRILKNAGIKAGTVLLERLTPYDEIAAGLAEAISGKPRIIVFLEEEIRAGGMGILLSDAIRRQGYFNNSEHLIIALDNPFARQTSPRPIFEFFGIDAESVARKIMDS
ncbi:MAG: 1-deoxy-D-xylulose-5-phosphate synthase [Clostridiales bacterium]|nr:1-deoxy-D-xylulose-5-phosphate synthase [Clostridiales bacterium]